MVTKKSPIWNNIADDLRAQCYSPLTLHASRATKPKAIGRLLGLSAGRKKWLALPAQDEVVTFIYQYLFKNQGEEGFVALAQDAFPKIISHPGVFHSMNPFIIAKRINDSALDACTKGILSQFKNLQQNDIAVILAKFGNQSLPYILNFSNQAPTNVTYAAETDWTRDTNDNAYLIAIPFVYVLRMLQRQLKFQLQGR